MSHMSHRRITVDQRTRKVGHHHAGLMSHMSHPRGPVMSLMSHMGHSTVPPSAQLSGPMGHVGHDPGPFPTWPSPPPGGQPPGGAGDAYAPSPDRGDAAPAALPGAGRGPTAGDRQASPTPCQTPAEYPMPTIS